METIVPKILIFGKNGQVAYELQKLLPSLGTVVALSSAECNLYDKAAIYHGLETCRPNIIVNAAAYTAVDKAESEQDKAFALNADAPAYIASWAKKHNTILVHYSTDYIFDGTKHTPITEEDTPNPLNIYGASKLKGDINIQASGCSYLIFRTTWVYGARGKNFYLTMRKLLPEREKLTVVDDQHGAPTHCADIAWATAAALKYTLNCGLHDTAKQLSAIYNLTNSGETTWFGFAAAIKDQMLKKDPTIKLADILPVKTSEYKTPAVRPHYSVLDNTKIAMTFGIYTNDWLTALQDVCRKSQRIAGRY
ncbi:MAG: dTDP-4-dehydrorhamnose reductase [Synergistes sp.]|nr:dTDP-4-dehydrorhamnose reductase [Synergistes sp.]